MRRGIFLAPFDELCEPALVAELAVEAERRGWEGFFLWDHVAYAPPVRALADPWVTMAAIAVQTERILIGPMVTPVARRRPHQLARETATLDRLSGGRLIFGVGAGSDRSPEFDPAVFGEEGDIRVRAKLLDEGLDKLLAYWAGEFEPRPIQQPRIPIWVAARWPNRRPLARAARHDGVFPIDMTEPDQLAEMVAHIKGSDPFRQRGLTPLGKSARPAFDVVVELDPGVDPQPWVDAGATWVLTSFGKQPRLDEVRAAISGGPGPRRSS